MKVSAFYDQTHDESALAIVEEEAEKLTPLYDRIVLPWLPPEPAARIYEVACGSGIMLRWLRKRGFTEVSGSDSSMSQIQIARAAGFPVKVADSLEELRSASENSMDCIIGFNFYEHLPQEVMLDFFAETCRVLKAGGCLILHGPNGDSPIVGRALFNDITHHWALTSHAFRLVLKMAGFKEVEFRDGTTAAIRRWRAVKVPLILAARTILRLLFRLATLERVEFFSASFFICARKAGVSNHATSAP